MVALRFVLCKKGERVEVISPQRTDLIEGTLMAAASDEH